MSARDETLGVGIFRENVGLESVESALASVLNAAQTLGWELHGRSSDEKLTDAEVELLNAVSLYESYKLNPWAALKPTTEKPR